MKNRIASAVIFGAIMIGIGTLSAAPAAFAEQQPPACAENAFGGCLD